MVGAPISYSGNQPGQPPSASTGCPPPQMYATPNSTISTLLPYDGGAPPLASGSYPATGPGPQNMPASTAPPSYLFGPPNPVTSGPSPQNMPASAAPPNYLFGPPNPAALPFPPPNPQTNVPYPVSSAAPPPPFPPCSTAAPPPFPPCSTAPQANPYNQNSANTAYPPAPQTNSYPPNPGNTSTLYGAAAPPPYSAGYPPNQGVNQPPAVQTTHPPAGYPPQLNNPHQPQGGYSTGSHTGNYAQPTSTYQQVTSQPPPNYSKPSYSVPPPNGGVYPPPPAAAGVYPPPY